MAVANKELQAGHWPIFIVAFEEDAAALPNTIKSVKELSYSQNITVLTSINDDLTGICESLSVEINACLPKSSEPKNYWLDVLSSLKYNGEPSVFVHCKSKVVTQWDARLLAQYYLSNDSQTLGISPLSARHEMHRVSSTELKQPALDADSVDQWINDYVDGLNTDIPVVLPGAALVAGVQWKDGLNKANSDLQLFSLMRAKGCVLACDQLYIDDSNLKDEFFDLSSHNEIHIAAVTDIHPIMPTQHAMAELIGRAEKPVAYQSVKPVQLHLAHSWGGGLGRWVEDYIVADADHRNLVLRPLGSWDGFGQSIALYRGEKMDVPIKVWAMSQTIPATAIHHREYQQALKEIIAEFGVESLLVSSLIGQSLDALRVDLPITFVCHDFYPFCPAIVATFETPCSTCDSQAQSNCRKNNPHHRFFDNEDDLHWDLLRPEFIALIARDNIEVVVPSKSVIDRFNKLVPEFKNKKFNVIEHGLGADLIEALEPAKNRSRSGSDRMSIVILGSLAKIKGEEIFKAALPDLLKFADIHLIGCGDSGEAYEKFDSVSVIKSYKRDELAAYIEGAKPDVGLLLSIVPETFSYTLSELWAAGIPVLATDLGAFSDRVKTGINGWLVSMNFQDVLAQLQELHEDPEKLLNTLEALKLADTRTAKSMVSEYNLLHGSDNFTWMRFNLPRRTFYNPYKVSHSEPQNEALFIDQQTPYKRVLLEFLSYSRDKLLKSPRMNRIARKPLGYLLNVAIKRLQS